MSTPRVVRKDMWGWTMSHEEDKWTVKLDVTDLGGGVLTPLFVWLVCHPCCWGQVGARLVLTSVVPLDFHGRFKVVRSMFVPGALHGTEAAKSGVCVWPKQAEGPSSGPPPPSLAFSPHTTTTTPPLPPSPHPRLLMPGCTRTQTQSDDCWPSC